MELRERIRAVSLTRAYIENVEFKSGDSSGRAQVSVTAHFGKRPMKPEDAKACVDEQRRKQTNAGPRFFPITTRYHIDFLFDGHDYRVAPASAAAARIFTDH